jgi:hypothetical protein
VYRVGLPRTDLKVTLDGIEIKPTLALGSWLAFQKIGDQAMVTGDGFHQLLWRTCFPRSWSSRASSPACHLFH